MICRCTEKCEHVGECRNEKHFTPLVSETALAAEGFTFFQYFYGFNFGDIIHALYLICSKRHMRNSKLAMRETRD